MAHRVGQVRELPDSLGVDEAQPRGQEPARQQRRPGAEGHWRHAQNDLVEQPMIVEHPDELAASGEPYVFALRGHDHRRVHGPDITADEVDLRARDWRSIAVREDPGWGVAIPRAPFPRLVEEVLVFEHPLVTGRAHTERADVGKEHTEPVGAVPLDLTLVVVKYRVLVTGSFSRQFGFQPFRVVLHRGHRPYSVRRGHGGQLEYERQ